MGSKRQSQPLWELVDAPDSNQGYLMGMLKKRVKLDTCST